MYFLSITETSAMEESYIRTSLTSICTFKKIKYLRRLQQFTSKILYWHYNSHRANLNTRKWYNLATEALTKCSVMWHKFTFVTALNCNNCDRRIKATGHIHACDLTQFVLIKQLQIMIPNDREKYTALK